MTLIRNFLIVAIALVASSPAVAQSSFPSRQVHFIVGYPAGAGNDLIARVFSDYLAALWKQPVIVENRAGASGSIGAAAVARAPADGYTLLLAGSSHLIYAAMTPDLAFKAVDDYAPVSIVGTGPLILEVKKTLQANSVKELIELAKSKPNELTYGSAGTGTSLHIAAEMFDRAMGVSMRHIPYKGSAPAQTDLMGGQIDLMFQVTQAAIPTIVSKDVRALAVTGEKRLPDLPDVPTFREAGYPDFDLQIWWGFMAPQATPKDVVEKLNADIRTALKDETVRKRLRDLGLQPKDSTTAEFLQTMNTDFDLFKKLVKEVGIRNE